jgi:small conductance mechanosensitive channel
VKSDDYWTVRFDILVAVKQTFDENNISIPYNQLDVHIKKEG